MKSLLIDETVNANLGNNWIGSFFVSNPITRGGAIVDYHTTSDGLIRVYSSSIAFQGYGTSPSIPPSLTIYGWQDRRGQDGGL
jgi:hypothetical protein